MKIQEIIAKIENDSECSFVIRSSSLVIENKLDFPEDLIYFYSKFESLDLFVDKPFGIKILPVEDVIVTSKKLYPEDDVIWEELEGDISNDWYLIAEAPELSQYISIDLSSIHKGYCYDSFLEIHATPGESPIIAKSFTELLVRLYESKGEFWYWNEPNFKSYGDAYDEH